MKKVLVISTVGLMYDGITSVILSQLKAMDLSDLDVLVLKTIKAEDKIVAQFEEIGCRIVEIANRRTEPVKYFFDLVKLIRKEKIEVVHAHGNSGTLAIEVSAAWMGGCKKRIAHSHSTKCDQVAADKLLRPIFNLFYTDALACGDDAGKWLFRNKSFTVLKNGRDLNLFLFDPIKREQMRKEFGISDNLVIGHVGGFCVPKNHVFLTKIYSEILKLRPTAQCFLIGDGPLKNEIEALMAEYKDNVHFTGAVSNVPDYLQMMDGMLLPSLFEGLPLVAIEWQINGLPSLLSDTITTDCKVSNLIEFENINVSPRIWAERIIDLAENNNRKDAADSGMQSVRKCGFDIEESARVLKNIYLS